MPFAVVITGLEQDFGDGGREHHQCVHGTADLSDQLLGGARVVGVSSTIKWPVSLGYAEWFELVRQSPLIMVDLCVGGLILGLPLAIAGYVLALRAVRICRTDQRTRGFTMDGNHRE